MQKKRITILFRALLIVALVSISILATVSEVPLSKKVSDKMYHLAAFFVLSLLVDFSWPDTGFDARKFLPLLGYGLAIEIVQYFLPGRFFSLLDLLADGTGLFLYSRTIPLFKALPVCKARWKPDTDNRIE